MKQPQKSTSRTKAIKAKASLRKRAALPQKKNQFFFIEAKLNNHAHSYFISTLTGPSAYTIISCVLRFSLKEIQVKFQQ